MMFHPDDLTLTRHSRVRRDDATDGVRTRDAASGEPRAGQTAHPQPEAARAGSGPGRAALAGKPAPRVAGLRNDLTRTGDASGSYSS
jgi:hypothetical protein